MEAQSLQGGVPGHEPVRGKTCYKVQLDHIVCVTFSIFELPGLPLPWGNPESPLLPTAG